MGSWGVNLPLVGPGHGVVDRYMAGGWRWLAALALGRCRAFFSLPVAVAAAGAVAVAAPLPVGASRGAVSPPCWPGAGTWLFSLIYRSADIMF